ncbi:hypothetical protein OB905_10235 [Halobacteria archaeon AArc-dxtr1]|nr:hypothetical protein [Halobacteria archaeon AArc-dxtr1]
MDESARTETSSARPVTEGTLGNRFRRLFVVSGLSTPTLAVVLLSIALVIGDVSLGWTGTLVLGALVALLGISVLLLVGSLIGYGCWALWTARRLRRVDPDATTTGLLRFLSLPYRSSADLGRHEKLQRDGLIATLVALVILLGLANWVGVDFLHFFGAVENVTSGAFLLR